MHENNMFVLKKKQSILDMELVRITSLLNPQKTHQVLLSNF